MRWLLILLLVPLAFSYTLGDYTEGKPVFIRPGETVKLVLPFPEGEDCLPVAVLFVSGGKDYPEINVNGRTFVGEGMHRLVLEGNAVEIVAYSTSPAFIEANSLFYCTRDPFVFVRYVPPNPIRVGTYNFLSVVLTNYGFSEAEINLEIRFHPNLAPYTPVVEKIRIPAKSQGVYTVFLISAPFVMKPSAHPRVCISYRDSVMLVKDCDGPVPTETVISPRILCIDKCYNTSNLILELNGMSIRPGDPVPEGVVKLLAEQNADIAYLEPTSEYKPFEAKKEWYFASFFIGAGIGLMLGRWCASRCRRSI
ncbi:MAG: hypothetical protein GXO00_03350 [Candidatus Diapherotrites archaeon]|nr:hypothetical protein [Candidatus Diapherotrites archaeon]